MLWTLWKVYNIHYSSCLLDDANECPENQIVERREDQNTPEQALTLEEDFRRTVLSLRLSHKQTDGMLQVSFFVKMLSNTADWKENKRVINPKDDKTYFISVLSYSFFDVKT